MEESVKAQLKAERRSIRDKKWRRGSVQRQKAGYHKEKALRKESTLLYRFCA